MHYYVSDFTPQKPTHILHYRSRHIILHNTFILPLTLTLSLRVRLRVRVEKDIFWNVFRNY